MKKKKRTNPLFYGDKTMGFSDIDVKDREIGCKECGKSLGYQEFEGSDVRVQGYTNGEHVNTIWDFTWSFCPECYKKEMGDDNA